MTNYCFSLLGSKYKVPLVFLEIKIVLDIQTLIAIFETLQL